MHKILFSLPVSFETYQGLGNFMYAHGFKQEMFELVDDIITGWMAEFEAAESKRKPTTLEGYQWKDVFLPDGTTLRNVYRRTSYLAHIEGRELHFEGRSVSPAEFVNAVGGSFRNAWKTVWIRFPNENEWKLAITLRNMMSQIKRKQVGIRGHKSE
jgi:hypothetical protein